MQSVSIQMHNCYLAVAFYLEHLPVR